MDHIEQFVKDIEQSLEWFCHKVVEPVPLTKADKDKVFRRMIQLGWIRQSEVETYHEATRED